MFSLLKRPLIFLAFSLIFSMTLIGTARAQFLLQDFATNAGYPTKDQTIENTATKVINVALMLSGILFMAMSLYAGMRWMTARGNEEYVTKAKDALEAGIIGMVVISLSYVITNKVFTLLPGGPAATENSAPSTVSLACVSDSECKSPQTCVNAVCSTPPPAVGAGANCEQSPDNCVAGQFCSSNNTCQTGCKASVLSDCPGGQTCTLGVCTASSMAQVGTACDDGAGFSGTCQVPSYWDAHHTAVQINAVAPNSCLNNTLPLNCFSSDNGCKDDSDCSPGLTVCLSHSCSALTKAQKCSNFNNSSSDNYWLASFNKCVSINDYTACNEDKTSCEQSCQKVIDDCNNNCSNFDSQMQTCVVGSSNFSSCTAANAQVTAKKLACNNNCTTKNSSNVNKCQLVDCQNKLMSCLTSIAPLY